MPFFNAWGAPMPESRPEGGNVRGTPAGDETISAGAGDISLSGEGGGDVLVGGAGDNRFFVTSPKDQIQEAANGGLDTQIAYLSQTLAPNVENLIVHGDFNFAVGNALANLIVVDGSQWVNGKGGDDVLVGSATQRTTFQVERGGGSDVIYNWNGNSQLQLQGHGLTTAADVRAAMRQVGDDAVLDLGGGETLTFRGVTAAAFADRQFLLPLDAARLGATTFSDEFDSLSLFDPNTGAGRWNSNFGGNLKDQFAYTLPPNGERQVYVASGFQGRGEQDLGVDPFSVSDGVLTITARPIADEASYAAWGAEYASGMLNTLGAFTQKYGYFEMRAELPTTAGTWPAFWLLPSPYQPGAEADIMEGLGATPTIDYRRAYGGEGGGETIYDNAYAGEAAGFHTYGMLWTPTTVTFYRDGVAVLQGGTPSTWTSPMGMIVNLAIGGWGGEPDVGAFPAQLKIDYVRAYALADGTSQVVNLSRELPVATLVDRGAASGEAHVSVTFEAGGGSVADARILVTAARPSDLPPGKAFVIWQDGGAVFGAVSDGTTLGAATPLMAGDSSQFTGAGTWLSNGKVALGYLKSDAAGHELWDMVFDPATRTFVRQALGPAAVDAEARFVATSFGGFAVSWHAPDGAIVARGYDEYAYGGDIPGWYGPVRTVGGDLVGRNSAGQLIFDDGDGQQLYLLARASTASPPALAIGPTTVSHAEGGSGAVSYSFTLVRSGSLSEPGSVVWTVTGSGANPADAADFVGGGLPSGAVDFAGGEASKTIIVNVAGDNAAEPDETFVVSVSHPVGVRLANSEATGVIANDDSGSPGGGGGRAITSPGPNSTLVGGDGDDTITASAGGDVVTGGAGADTFVLATEPWSPVRITDFALGSDRLDLAALLQRAGYVGPDPVADRYVTLLDDGVGGTKVLFDSDGAGPSPQWANYVLKLDGVAAPGLSWAQLTGAAAPPPPPPPPPPATAGAMVVFAGQSNMGAPYQDAASVTARWTADPNLQIWNAATRAWEPMRPGVNTGYPANPGGWGPEVAFAIDFRAAHPGEVLRIVKSVYGGTPLAPDTGVGQLDWAPGSVDELFDATDRMITDASAAAGGLRPSAVFFGQGEADANAAATAEAYGDNLAAFFTAVRADWLDDPAGKIGYFRIGTSPSFAAAVREGGLRVDEADPNATSFDAAGFPVQADGLHFSAGGLDQAGDAFFGLYQGWSAPAGGTGGRVITSPGPNSTVVGTAGDDTILASAGGDVLTGGAGGDRFSLPSEPWAPVAITDFILGADRLDLSALFQRAGYAGADPVADRYLAFIDDSAGGVKVLFDRDGAGPDPQWPNYVLQLEHVVGAGLTWAQLSGGSTPPPGGGGGGPPPPSNAGAVIRSPGPGSTLTGGTADDTLIASQGPDVLTGGAGADHFAFDALPWSAGRVTDFAPGEDRLDLRALFLDAGYAGADPVRDGYLRVSPDGAGGTKVFFDPDGPASGNPWPFHITTVDHAVLAGSAVSDWLVYR